MSKNQLPSLYSLELGEVQRVLNAFAEAIENASNGGSSFSTAAGRTGAKLSAATPPASLPPVVATTDPSGGPTTEVTPTTPQPIPDPQTPTKTKVTTATSAQMSAAAQSGVTPQQVRDIETIVANLVVSTDYTQDGTGMPLTGFKLDNSETTYKLKVGAGWFGSAVRIGAGTYTLGDTAAKAITAIASTGSASSDRAWYRGNNDSTVLGGAPDISTLTITRRRWDPTNRIGRFEFKIQPTTADDNLDGMRYAKVALYQQSVRAATSGAVNATLTIGANAFYDRVSGGSGSFITDGFVAGHSVTISGFANGTNNVTGTITGLTATRITMAITTQVTPETNRAGVVFTLGPVLTAIDTFYYPMCDRLFVSLTDSNAGNAAFMSMMVSDTTLGASNIYPAMVVTLYNAYGPSASHCYYSNTGSADGSTLTDSGTSFPSSFSTGGSGGGSGGGGGGGDSCPDPSVCLLMASGNEKPAGEIQKGDIVVAWDGEHYDSYPVISVDQSTNERWRMTMANGRSGIFAPTHRFLVDGAWTKLMNIQLGQTIQGPTPSELASIEALEPGPVVKITVDKVHNYVTFGLLSHNMKPV